MASPASSRLLARSLEAIGWIVEGLYEEEDRGLYEEEEERDGVIE